MLPITDQLPFGDFLERSRLAAYGIILAVAITPVIVLLHGQLELRDVNILYLVPVVIAATRSSLTAALGAAVAGSAASAFFFYSPFYSRHVVSPQDFLDLMIFVGVALVTSQLSAASRQNATVAERRLADLERLYAFSRKLALAIEPKDILNATQEHLTAQIGARALILSTPDDNASKHDASLTELPAVLHQPIGELQMERRTVTDPSTGRHWLLQRLPHKSASESAVLAVDLGHASFADLPALQRRIDTTVGEAISSLEHLDLAKAVSQANMRREAQSLREAVVGSVSHGLRTPLAAIMGSASILAETPLIKADARLASLTSNIVVEAERLNSDIQKLLDAAIVTGAGVTPHITWSEPADIVNAALERERHNLDSHHLCLRYADDLPLVHVDPVLVVQALALIIDNAVRYSTPGSSICIQVAASDGEVALSVVDNGIGLSASERPLVFQKFYRGQQVRDTTRGSGLGLWIANAFISACRGRVSLTPRLTSVGTNVTLFLPAASAIQMREIGGTGDH